MLTPLRGASWDVWEPPFGTAVGMTNWEKTPGIPRKYQRDYISHLSWEHFGIPKEEPVAGKKNTRLPAHPVGTVTLTRINSSKMDEWKDRFPPSTALPQLIYLKREYNVPSAGKNPDLSVSSTLLQAIKRKSLKKASVLSYKSFFCACLSAVNSFICFRSLFKQCTY